MRYLCVLFLLFVLLFLPEKSYTLNSEKGISDSVEILLKKTKNPEKQVELYLSIIKDEKYSYPDKVMTYAKKAYAIAESHNLVKQKLNLMLEMVDIKFTKTQYIEAMQCPCNDRYCY